MVGLEQEGLREGGGNSLKYLKRGWNRKEGMENKDFKKGGQARSRGGCIKRGGWSPLTNYVLLTIFKIRGYKRRNKPQNFLSFSFNPLASNFKAIPKAIPKLLSQEHPSEKLIFLWSSPYKTEIIVIIKIVIILTEMLEIPNFGHMTTSTI